MSSRLGEILGLTVNWPPFQRPPDLNWNGWRHAHQHVIVARSWRTQATVLVIPYATNQTLAQMILRRVAHQPISEAERKTAFFDTAGAILDAARQQRGDALERPSERPTGTRASQTTRRPQRSSQILVVADPINRSRALPLD